MAKKKAKPSSWMTSVYDVAKVAMLTGTAGIIGTFIGYFLGSSRSETIYTPTPAIQIEQPRQTKEQLERVIQERVNAEVKKRTPQKFYPLAFRNTSSPYDLVYFDEEGRSVLLVRQGDTSYSRLEDVQEAERISLKTEQEKDRLRLEESQKAEIERARLQILHVKGSR